MLDRLPPTFMGQQMGTETRGYFFFVPGFREFFAFFFAEARRPAQNIYTKACCVLSRRETYWVYDAVNWQLIGTGRKIFRLHPAAAIYRIGSLSTPSGISVFLTHACICFEGHIDDELPRHTSAFFKNSWYFQQTSDFRILGWLK